MTKTRIRLENNVPIYERREIDLYSSLVSLCKVLDKFMYPRVLIYEEWDYKEAEAFIKRQATLMKGSCNVTY